MTLRLQDSWPWPDILDPHDPKFSDMWEKINHDCKTETVYPPQNQIFRAFELCPFDKVKVVLLGQDPFYQEPKTTQGPPKANGLAFSISEDHPIDSSLKNMFQEIHDDLGLTIPPETRDLSPWADEGVLLMNAFLTVKKGQKLSHKEWGSFTDAVIEAINNHKEHVVFLLWGTVAKKKAKLIDKTRHKILETSHPSDMWDAVNKGFFGSKHFSKTNKYLEDKKKSQIDWQV